MERLKKGVTAIRNGAGNASARLTESMKEKLAQNPVHPGHLGQAVMERMHVPEMTYRRVQIGGRTIQQERQLNEGGFAFVHLGRDTHTGEEFVLKVIPCQDKASMAMARREVDILEKLPFHANLVKYYGHAIFNIDGNSKEVVLLFELCPGGHLLDLLELHHCRLSEAKILSVFTDVCTAVSLLHAREPPIAHRDLKVENILLGASGSFKLCDFGSWSDQCSNPSNMDRQAISALQENIDKYTTMMYRPPEMIDFYQAFEITEKVDIWMLGCILFTLMFCRHPFQDESTLAISNARYDVPAEPVYSDKLQDLVHWLLARNPTHRPSAADLCQILETFHDGKRLDLPQAVVKQRDRGRGLYDSINRDVDAPLTLAGHKKDRAERKPKNGVKDSASKHSESSSKHRPRSSRTHKEHHSKKENLATWGDMGGDAWPSTTQSVPQPSCDWASFDTAPQSMGDRRSAGSPWAAWDQTLGHTTASSSRAAPKENRRQGSLERPRGPWDSPAQEGLQSARRHSHSSDDWDPFRAKPMSDAQRFAHGRSKSFHEEASPRASVLESDFPQRSVSAKETVRNSSAWPFEDADDDAASTRPRFRHRRSLTGPLPNSDESRAEWEMPRQVSAETAPPTSSNSSPWPDPVVSAPPKSPWDPPSGHIPPPVVTHPEGQLFSQGPWIQKNDSFDWLTQSFPSSPVSSKVQ